LKSVKQTESASKSCHLTNFEEMVETFLKQYRERLLRALRNVLTGDINFKPAHSLASEVKCRFLQACKSGESVLPALHGTKAANHDSILRSGLVIPNSGTGVSVCNGSSHGLGIYTAKLSNPYLARGFCSEPRMLVCAVADDAAPLEVPRLLGSFHVTAESRNVRHVGDAIVVLDAGHVVPLFEASGNGFSTNSSFVPRPAEAAVPSPAPSGQVQASALKAALLHSSQQSETGRQVARKLRRQQLPVVSARQLTVERFLSRRAALRRSLRNTSSTRPA